MFFQAKGQSCSTAEMPCVLDARNVKNNNNNNNVGCTHKMLVRGCTVLFVLLHVIARSYILAVFITMVMSFSYLLALS